MGHYDAVEPYGLAGSLLPQWEKLKSFAIRGDVFEHCDKSGHLMGKELQDFFVLKELSIPNPIGLFDSDRTLQDSTPREHTLKSFGKARDLHVR